MAIEITEFANVSISVSPTGVQSGNFGVLGFLAVDTDNVLAGKDILPAELTRAYTSLPSVGADWAADSEVYKAAVAFYSQTPTPTDFTVLMSYSTTQSAALVGGSHLEADDLIAASWNGTGELTFTCTAGEVAITDLDVSAASPATLDGIAAEIRNAIQAETNGTGVICVHDGYRFVITDAASGSASSISFADDSVTTQNLGLTAAFAKVSSGIDPETAVESLAVALSKGVNWVGTVTDKRWRDYTSGVLDSGESAEDIAIWCEGAKRIFCNTTNALSTLVSTTGHVAAALKSRTLRFSLTSFSRDTNAYPSASVFGRAASVNFSAIGSTITLNLKQMPTIAAENLEPGEFKMLRANYASAVVQIGTSVNAYTDSRMASGSWLDTTHGLMWLEDRCETDMFNLLYATNTKIPYTQVGINTAAATLERSLSAARRNGLCAPGYLPDGTYLSEGYVVTSVALADIPVSDKSNRVYKGLGFKMVGAGALQEVEVEGQFSE